VIKGAFWSSKVIEWNSSTRDDLWVVGQAPQGPTHIDFCYHSRLHPRNGQQVSIAEDTELCECGKWRTQLGLTWKPLLYWLACITLEDSHSSRLPEESCCKLSYSARRCLLCSGCTTAMCATNYFPIGSWAHCMGRNPCLEPKATQEELQ
jgi:hypothetical protein